MSLRKMSLRKINPLNFNKGKKAFIFPMLKLIDVPERQIWQDFS